MSNKKRRHFLKWFERKMEDSWMRFCLKYKFNLGFLDFDYLRHKYHDIFAQYKAEKGYSDKWNKEI